MAVNFGPRPLQRLVAYSLLSLGCVAFALAAGKDLNWDLLNYHYYIPYSLFHDRLAQDFFPASSLSYSTPYAYVPFYLLVSAGLDDRLVVAALALIGSTALWAVWEIGGLLGAAVRGGQSFATVPAWLGVALAAICPVFFIQLGTSFIDVTTAAVALFGYLFLIRFVLGGSRSALPVAAVLLGVSVALKPTNAVYALVGVLLVLTAGSPRIRNLANYTLFGLLGGVAVMGPWWSQLYREFGNPFFPQFNSVFKSPDFDVAGSMAPHYRFIPESWSDALLRPVQMMSPEAGIYTEPPAPDARYFFLLALMAVACAVWVLRRTAVRAPASQGAQSCSRPVLLGTSLAFVASWCLWLVVSGNGRYFMPMALLAGPLVVSCVFYIGSSRRWAAYSLSAVFAISLSIVMMASVIRHHPSPWAGTFFDVEVPNSLLEREHLIISLDVQPAAFLAPLLHPGTGFINITGMHVLDPDRPGWGRVERLIRQTGSPMFLLAAKAGENGEMIPPDRGHLEFLTGRIGYVVDRERCEKIVVKNLRTVWPGMTSTVDGKPQVGLVHSQDAFFAVCPGRYDSALRPQYLAQSAKVNPLFEAVERRCPELLPAGAITQGLGDQWSRTYTATDSKLTYYNSKMRFERLGLRRQRVVGTADQIEAGNFSFDCSRKKDPLLTIEEVLG